MKQSKWFTKKRIGSFFFLWSISLVGFACTLRVKAENYSSLNEPRYVGIYADNSTVWKSAAAESELGAISVVSYNIRYAFNMEEAIVELKTLEAEQGADIILLQEMDEIGVERLAQAMSLNYVYYPVGIEPLYDHHMGNAILSKWPIAETEKIFLPHQSLSSGMNRVATRAVVTVQGVDVLVYSIHAETIMTLPRFRQDQFEAILADVDHDAEYVIIGGDFNTVTTEQVNELTALYQEAGFTRATADTGHTLTRFRMDAVADHVYSKGFTVVVSGKVAEATASDHLPVWARLLFAKKD
jgi:endonuclease/exonuclease/phosphatase family metal-dependent hydrolase